MRYNAWVSMEIALGRNPPKSPSPGTWKPLPKLPRSGPFRPPQQGLLPPVSLRPPAYMPEDTTEVPPAHRPDGEELTKASAEATVAPVEDWATRYKYLLADFDNFRRRVERDRESISRQARAGLVRELLPIIEAFRVARDSFARLPT